MNGDEPHTEAFAELQPGDLRGIKWFYGRGAKGERLANGPDSNLFKPAL
jgi:hypothetical protein